MSVEWDDLARLAEAATPGSWVPHARDGKQYVMQEGRGSVCFVGYLLDDYGDADVLADAAFIAAANPATILRLIEDNRKATGAAQTLGRIIEQQNRDALDASGMHHVVDETGDGDWEVVWEALALLRPERDALAARLAAVEALADETEQAGDPLLRLDRLRAALSTAPTDTTKEN